MIVFYVVSYLLILIYMNKSYSRTDVESLKKRFSILYGGSSVRMIQREKVQWRELGKIGISWPKTNKEVSKKTERRKLEDQEEVIPQNIALPEEEDINMAEGEEAVVVGAADFPF